MITTILFYIVSFLLLTFSGMANLLSFGFTIPDVVGETLTIFFVSMYKLDMVLNIGGLFLALKFFINFLVIYYSYRLLSSFFNWIRGSGKIDE